MTENSIREFDISAQSNLLIVAVMGETYNIEEISYHNGSQIFTQIGTTVKDAGSADADSPSAPNRDLSFWALADPMDTLGTDITLTLTDHTYSGAYFAVFSLENADAGRILMLSKNGSQLTEQALAVVFRDLPEGSFIIDASAQNTVSDTLGTTSGPERLVTHSARDFSSTGFISAAAGLGGDVMIGANGIADEQSTYGAIAIKAKQEPTPEPNPEPVPAPEPAPTPQPQLTQEPSSEPVPTPEPEPSVKLLETPEPIPSAKPTPPREVQSAEQAPSEPTLETEKAPKSRLFRNPRLGRDR